MSRFLNAAALLGIIAAVIVTVFCIVLLPLPVPIETWPSTYSYTANKNGLISFTEDGKKEKLRIHSNVLNFTNGQLKKNVSSSCGFVQASVSELNQFIEDDIKCWIVESLAQQTLNCDDDDAVQVQDCLFMQTEGGEPVYWYGGAEMVVQKWPINGIHVPRSTVFLSSDLPGRYGNVLERYYISSFGVAIYVYPETPLYVSMLANNKICLEAAYQSDDIQPVGPGYLKPNDENLWEIMKLQYAVCIGSSTSTVHQSMTNPNRGFIKRPSFLPDLKMMQDPIWSTWARYKAEINQTIVEEFAKEILKYNFTNSQLEIDDGYEMSYGDFTFDENKFPNATRMIENLHKWGFRVTTWVTPFVNLDSKNYEAGKAQGHFIFNEKGQPEILRWWNGEGSPIDFTSKAAGDWYKTLLENVKLKYGVDSFKFDAGESTYLPQTGLKFAKDPKPNPGDYTTAYSRVAFDIGQATGEMRSSWKTQDINFYMRLMDKGSSWTYPRGFHTVIPTALTFSILGYPYVLPDMIGGNAYVFGRGDKPLRELYIRWLELSAFLPCMQFSISPWQYDDEVVEIAQRFTNLHRTVVYDELKQSAQRYINGEMSLLVSPLWMHSDANDSDAFSIDDEFVVGDRYLVAPIITEGSTSRDIYLPGKKDVRWKDKMRQDCNNDAPDCIVSGGSWVISYNIPLNDISWWEKLP